MSSKIIDTPFYKESKKQGTVIPNFIFTETFPPRFRAMIPGFQLYYMMNHGDNNWVDL